MPADAVALVVKVGGIHFSGECWLASPQLYAEGGETIIPPFMHEYYIYPYMQEYGRPPTTWFGENLSRFDWPEFVLSIDGHEVFSGSRFNAASRGHDFEILLPALLAWRHSFTLALTTPHHFAYPFNIMNIDLREESARPLEIVGYPGYAAEGGAVRVLVERNIGETGELDVVSVDAGAARAAPLLDFTLDEQRFSLPLLRVVRYDAPAIPHSTTDTIFIQSTQEMWSKYIAWSMQQHVVDAFALRPAYRWMGGIREADATVWRKVVPLFEKLGTPYFHMLDCRDLVSGPGNPPVNMLDGTLFRGRQQHEYDMFAYFNIGNWQKTDALYQDLWIRASRECDGMRVAERPWTRLNDETVMKCFDPLRAGDMREAAQYFINNLSLQNACPRHTGPTTLFRYFFQAGYRWVGVEQYGPEEINLASLRGAARAAGQREYGTHIPMQWESKPHDSRQHADRYFLSLATSYLQGATEVNTEDGLWRMEMGGEKSDRFSHATEIHRDAARAFMRFKDTHPRRGELYVPVAVFQGRYCGWACYGRPAPVWGSDRPEFRFGPPEESFDLLNVFYPRSVVASIYRVPCPTSPQGWFTGTPFGPVDLLPVEASAAVLARYRVAIFLGWNTFSEDDFAALADFVQQGGTLLLAKPHVSAEVRRMQPSDIPQDSASLGVLLGEYAQDMPDTDTPVVRSVGKGKVIYFPADCYPADPRIRARYQQEMCDSVELVCAHEASRGWIRGNNDVHFAVYEQPNRDLRTIYLLNIDWWSGRPAASATLRFGGGEWPIAARAGVIEVMTISPHLAVMPVEQDMDILDIREDAGIARITVQSDAGGDIHVFLAAEATACRVLNVPTGGVQEFSFEL